MHNIIVSIDGHCNIPQDICKQYGIYAIPFDIEIDGQLYEDLPGSIDMEDIVRIWRQKGVFPHTSAISPAKYIDFFNSKIKDDFQILHINLGSGGSGCFNNCRLAIDCLNSSNRVFQFDSQNISFGLLLLAIHAVELIKKCDDISVVLKNLVKYRESLRSSYYISRLDFISQGGRLVKKDELSSKEKYYEIIIENNQTKFNAEFDCDLRQSLTKIIDDRLRFLLFNKEHVFVDSSMLLPIDIQNIKKILKRYDFKNIYISHATCSCAGHMGPNAFGFYFEMER